MRSTRTNHTTGAVRWRIAHAQYADDPHHGHAEEMRMRRIDTAHDSFEWLDSYDFKWLVYYERLVNIYN